MMNDADLKELLGRLEEKYQATGQDLHSYLEGLHEADYLNYWDYIHLDALLNLQIPRTLFPDEQIFIMYHQITELYFKLILHELNQLAQSDPANLGLFEEKIGRVNRYFGILISSFPVMIEGMEPKQFLKFRMALLPASGFQSVQYRMIELSCTDAIQLVDSEFRSALQGQDLKSQLERTYWRKGSTELATGKKTLTLRRFEEKYDRSLLHFAEDRQFNNLRRKVASMPLDQPEYQGLKKALRTLDENANIHWPMAHMHSAVKYLKKSESEIKATGGTNWQRYLPPRFQKVIFFPEIWSFEEMDEWGKAGIQKTTVKPF
jgi:tryptophan 2,3-dioxygenase